MEKDSVHGKHFYKLIPILIQVLVYSTAKIIFALFADIKISGLGNTKTTKSAIFAVNHTSEWDPVFLRSTLPFFSSHSPMYYVSMSKEEYKEFSWRKFFYGGKLFEFAGAYPRYSGRRNYAYSLQNHIKILEKGGSVCIFPEGKRTMDGIIKEAHGGTAYLAYKTHTPVIPVSIKGLVDFSMVGFMLGKKPVRIHFGKPMLPETFIFTEHPLVEDYRNGSEIIMNKIKEKLSYQNIKS